MVKIRETVSISAAIKTLLKKILGETKTGALTYDGNIKKNETSYDYIHTTDKFSNDVNDLFDNRRSVVMPNLF